MKSNSKSKLSKLYLLLIYIFLYLPIIILVLFSFNKSKLNAIWTGFSFKWYISLIHNVGILEAMKNSLIIAFVSTIVSVMLGTVTAVGMYKYNFKGKGILSGVLYLPIVIPEIVMGISLLAFFSRIKIPTGMLTLIIAHITFSVSYVVIVVKASLDGFDRSLEDAAMDLGATPVQTLYKIILPIIVPGIVAGGLLAFTLSLDDVIISFFVAGPESTTLPLKVFSMVKFGVTPEINALSTIMMVITLAVALFAEKIRMQNVKKEHMLKVLSVFLAFICIFSGGVYISYRNAKHEQGELNVFNWSEYLPQSVIDDFQKKYNIKVNYSTFSSNEEMLAKIKAGGSQYDLVVASDYMVEIMKKQDLIKKINMSEVPNFKNIGQDFKNLEFDPGNKYSVPYMWGTAVIAVDKSKIKDKIDNYSDLWKPEFKNSLVVLDDQRVMIGAALKKLGYTINETDQDKLDKAKEELLKLTPNIKAYDSDSPKTLLINGEAKAGYVWGAEAILARHENKNIEIINPKDGVFLQQDNFVMPSSAKHEKAAEEFINYILDENVSAEISKSFPYANPNIEAQKYMSESTLNDMRTYPNNDELKKGEHLKDIGSYIKLYDQIWSQIKK